MLKVLYFAGLRDTIGVDEEELDPCPANIAAALEVLCQRHPQLRPVLAHVRIAKNREISNTSEQLSPGDSLALMPPFTGG